MQPVLSVRQRSPANRAVWIALKADLYARGHIVDADYGIIVAIAPGKFYVSFLLYMYKLKQLMRGSAAQLGLTHPLNRIAVVADMLEDYQRLDN